MSTDDNDAYGDLDKSNLKFIYEQFLRYRKGLYSRRIDEANRLVYEISDDVVTILRCKGHYDD